MILVNNRNGSSGSYTVAPKRFNLHHFAAFRWNGPIPLSWTFFATPASEIFGGAVIASEIRVPIDDSTVKGCESMFMHIASVGASDSSDDNFVHNIIVHRLFWLV